MSSEVQIVLVTPGQDVGVAFEFEQAATAALFFRAVPLEGLREDFMTDSPRTDAPTIRKWRVGHKKRKNGIPRPTVLWCSNQRQGRGNKWSFPPNVEKLLRAKTEGQSVLHMFGGLARWGTRLDVDSIVLPHVIGDAWMPPFARDSFDVVILDPPYDRLGRDQLVQLFQTACWIARKYIVWFHTLWVPSLAHARPRECYLIRCGDNCLVRCVQFFDVPETKMEPSQFVKRGPARKYNRWRVPQKMLPFSELLLNGGRG